MKTKETLAPNRLPVTWGNRVATILMIGLPWLAARLLAELDNLGWQHGFLNMGITVGAWPATLGFVIALFAKNKISQRWSRCFAFWVTLPLTMLLVLMIENNYLENSSTKTILVIQFSVLFLSHIAFLFLSWKNNHGNINSSIQS